MKIKFFLGSIGERQCRKHLNSKIYYYYNLYSTEVKFKWTYWCNFCKHNYLLQVMKSKSVYSYRDKASPQAPLKIDLRSFPFITFFVAH